MTPPMWFPLTNDHVALLSQPLITSNTLSIDPQLYSSWFYARLQLIRMGLEARFIEPVITAHHGQAMVHAIRYGFPTHP